MKRENQKIFKEIIKNCGISKEYDRYDQIEKFVKFFIATIETFPENSIVVKEIDADITYKLYFSFVHNKYRLYTNNESVEYIELQNLIERIIESSKDLRISLRVL